jgi:hypothetical protein
MDLFIDSEIICKNLRQSTEDKFKLRRDKMSLKNIEIKESNGVIEEVVIDEKFFDFKVNDEIRYVLEIKNNEFKLSSIIDNNYDEIKIIMIVLESPHRNEFKPNMSAIGPAMGKTKEGIEINLINKIKNLINITNNNNLKNKLKDGKYLIYLSNPVKSQASLGYFYEGKIIKSIRNNVWKFLWNKERYNYYGYIKRISDKIEIILNCCTSDLKLEIEIFFYKMKDDKILNQNVYIINSLNHPSTW